MWQITRKGKLPVFSVGQNALQKCPRGLERPGEASDGDFASGLLSIPVKRSCHPTLLLPIWAILFSWRVSSGLLPLDHFRGAVCGHSQAAEPNAQPRFFFLLSMGTFWKVLPRARVECYGSTQTVTVPAPQMWMQNLPFTRPLGSSKMQLCLFPSEAGWPVHTPDLPLRKGLTIVPAGRVVVSTKQDRFQMPST